MKVAQQKGFTLIEIMIVVGIIAILAAITLPMYNEYVRQAARTAGQNFLSDIAQQQELRFQNTRAYSTSWNDFPAMPADVSSRYAYEPPSKVIDATVAAGGVPARFTLQIKPLATGLLAAEGLVTIDSAGNRTWVDRHGNTKQWSEK